MRSRPLSYALVALVAAAPAVAAVTAIQPQSLRKAMGLRLGAWHTDFKMTELAVEPTPGADGTEAAKAEAALRPKIGEARTSDECLWDSPEQMFIPGIRVESGCEFSRVDARDGRFAVVMLCERPGSRVQTEMTGTYAPESVEGRFDLTITTGQMRIRMKAEGKSRHAGACPPPPIVTAPNR